MILICSYCGSQSEQDATKCGNCGAPVSRDNAIVPDYRSCPHCRRRLLALASPACNYCGRRLPDDYIKAREADLKRLSENDKSSKEVDEKVGEIARLSRRGKRRKQSSTLDALDAGLIVDLTDLFS